MLMPLTAMAGGFSADPSAGLMRWVLPLNQQLRGGAEPTKPSPGLHVPGRCCHWGRGKVRKVAPGVALLAPARR